MSDVKKIIGKIIFIVLIGLAFFSKNNTTKADAKTISEKQAVSIVQKKAGKQFLCVCDGKKVLKNGKYYYVVYVKKKIDDHYSTQTQYMVSTDKKVVAEGIYDQTSGKIQFYDKKLNNKIYGKVYSAKKLGLKSLYSETADKTYPKYNIVTVSANRVTARKCIFDEGVTYGRKKVFKISAKCKYYVGNPALFFKRSNKYDNALDVPFIRKVSKKEFKKMIGKKQWYDQMILKNGKVVKIFTNMQIAE